MEACCTLPVVGSLHAPPLPLTQDEENLLPPYTTEEWIRELRQRLVLLRWRAQRLRTRSR
jgi:hypothetical protein